QRDGRRPYHRQLTTLWHRTRGPAGLRGAGGRRRASDPLLRSAVRLSADFRTPPVTLLKLQERALQRHPGLLSGSCYVMLRRQVSPKTTRSEPEPTFYVLDDPVPAQVRPPIWPGPN